MTTPIFILKRSLAVHRENHRRTAAVNGVQKKDLQHFAVAIEELKSAIEILTERSEEEKTNCSLNTDH